MLLLGILPLVFSTLRVPDVHTHCGQLVRQLLSYQRVAITTTASAESITEGMRKAYQSVQNALPAFDPEAAPRIVDIGCGIGIYHVFVSSHYANRSHHFLVDREANQIDNPTRAQRRFAKRGGFHRDANDVAFYTSATCARKIASANGLTAERWQWVNASESNVRALGVGSVDVVMSLLSWGFHYPVSTYADAARDVLKPQTGRLILQLRAGLNPSGESVLEKEHGFRCSRLNAAGEQLSSTSRWYTVSCRVRGHRGGGGRGGGAHV